MGSWSKLLISSHDLVRTEDLERAIECLSAKDFLPALWPGLFDAQREESELAREESFGEEEKPPYVIFTTSLAAAQQRLERLWTSARNDAYFAQAWEGCGPLLEYLATHSPDCRLTLDPSELCQTVGGESTRSSIAETSHQLFACATNWSRAGALDVWKRFGEGDLMRDTIASLRWTGCDLPREALFVAACGWPTYDEAFEGRLASWVKAGPPRPHFRPVREDAELLLAHFQSEGLVTPTLGRNPKWLLGYLEIAAKHRTQDVLRECLSAAAATGAAIVGDISEGDIVRALAHLEESL